MATEHGAPVVRTSLTHAFGSYCSTGLRDAACFGDDSGYTLIHPVGRHVVLSNTESGEASFVAGGDDADAITSCTVSRERSFLAVGFRTAKEMQVTVSVAIYDVRSAGNGPAKVMEPFQGLPGPPLARAAAVAFSASSPIPVLCVASGGSEAAVAILDWHSDRVVGRSRLDSTVDRVAFSPQVDTQLVSLSGPHIFRLLHLRDAHSKTREIAAKDHKTIAGLEEKNMRITDHAWVEPGDGRLVLCSAEGLVYVLSSLDFCVVQALDNPFGSIEAAPRCIRCFSQGFIIGGNEGRIAIWDKVDSAEDEAAGQHAPQTSTVSSDDAPQEFAHSQTVRVRRTEAPVCCLDITGAEERILVGFRDASIGTLKFSAAYNSSNSETDSSVLCGGYHAGPITGLDMAVQRPLALSMCRKDCSVRLWNYVTKQCELCWHSPTDPPNAVALHPFGYFAAVGLRDRLCFFYVVSTELKHHHECPLPNIGLLRFSHGGHLLVAIQGKVAHIFSIHIVKQVATLKGHASDITALCFDPEDHSLWTCSGDGCLCEWDTQSWSLVKEHKTPGCQYLAAASPASEHVTCVGVEGTKPIVRRFKQHTVQSVQELPHTVRPTAICQHVGSSTVFLSTSTGILWRCSPQSPPVGDVGLHSGRCTAVCLSADARTLVTGGDDGAVFVVGISGLAPGEGGTDRIGETETRTTGADVMLIPRNYIHELQEECEDLRAKNTTLRTQLARETAQLEDEVRQAVREARQKDEAEIGELTRRCNALEQASHAKVRESQRILRSMEVSHNQAAEQLQHVYEKKIEYEADRFVSLELARTRLQEKVEEERALVARRQEEEEEIGRAELKRRLTEKNIEIQKHKDLIAFAQHRFESLLGKHGRDHDETALDQKVKNNKELLEQSQVEAKLRKEQDILLRGLEMMEKDRERSEKDQSDTTTDIKSLREQTEDLTKTLVRLNAEKKEREAALAEKEQKIESYKEKVSTLRKFKQHLDERLAEVAKSMQPKDHMIEQLNAHLRELEGEFEKQLSDQGNIESAIETKQQQVTHLSSVLEKLRELIQQKDRTIAAYSSDMHTLVMNPDTSSWPQEIRKLYHKHVCGEKAGRERLPLEEMQWQMRQVERKVASLAFRGSQMKSGIKQDIQRKAQEGAALVHELNNLRVSKKSLQREIKNLELRLAQVQESTLALEDTAPRRQLVDGSATPPAALPVVPPAASLPRTPSGSLPGPRQQQQSPAMLRTAGATATAAAAAAAVPKGPRRPGSVPPLGRRANEQVLTLQTTAEDRKRIQSLLVTADISRQQLEMQKMENEVLRGKIGQLVGEFSTPNLHAAGGKAGDSLRSSSEALRQPETEPIGEPDSDGQQGE